MSKAQKAITKAVNKAITKGAKPIIGIDAAMAKLIAAVREHAANPIKGWGWELVAEFTDAEVAEVVTGALTTKTAIKKMARHLYRNIDPYGRLAARKAVAA